jgi:mono/diheme cytochrome c family protein
MKKSFRYFALVGAVLISAGLWLRPISTPSSAANESLVVPDGGNVYIKQCAECHGRDGRGKTFRGKHTHARDLTDAEWQDQVSDERIYNSISKGKGKMPGFAKQLSDAQIESLVTFVRNLKK